jgi:hypothetical protein
VGHYHIVIHVSSHGGNTTVQNRLMDYLTGFG